jgi:hypothetical protein
MELLILFELLLIASLVSFFTSSGIGSLPMSIQFQERKNLMMNIVRYVVNIYVYVNERKNMKRIEKIGDVMIKGFTLPIRVCIGLYKCIEKNTPERLEMPFEIKRKEDTDGRNKETTSC